MALDERLVRIIKKKFNYNDSQIEDFKNNERNEFVINKLKDIMNHVFVLTVVASHGCNTGHKVGDKIYLDACGNILTRYCPEKICTYALHNAILMVFTANEFLYNDMDPMKIQFRKSSCFDVGVGCGGLGQVILELSTIGKDELDIQVQKVT